MTAIGLLLLGVGLLFVVSALGQTPFLAHQIHLVLYGRTGLRILHSLMGGVWLGMGALCLTF